VPSRSPRLWLGPTRWITLCPGRPTIVQPRHSCEATWEPGDDSLRDRRTTCGVVSLSTPPPPRIAAWRYPYVQFMERLLAALASYAGWLTGGEWRPTAANPPDRLTRDVDSSWCPAHGPLVEHFCASGAPGLPTATQRSGGPQLNHPGSDGPEAVARASKPPRAVQFLTDVGHTWPPMELSRAADGAVVSDGHRGVPLDVFGCAAAGTTQPHEGSPRAVDTTNSSRECSDPSHRAGHCAECEQCRHRQPDPSIVEAGSV
jgi:hypothetical protein